MYAGLSFSPDGNYLMASVIRKPFSYIVPLSRFPVTTTVYDMKGATVKVVNEAPLNEIMPKGFSSVRTGKEIWPGEAMLRQHWFLLKLLMAVISRKQLNTETRFSHGKFRLLQHRNLFQNKTKI